MVERAEVLANVRAHLASELELDEADLSEQTRFREDLDADSLDLYELIMELEDTYSIRVDEAAAAEIKTVANAVDFVTRALGSSSGG